ncbi:MAG: delta-60 repeat domain-containing protein [Actinocatenispora sp.]
MRRFLTAIAALAALVLAGGVPATAAGQQPTVVSADPVDWTPHVLDGTVYAIAVVGDEVVVGGSFSHVTSAARSGVLVRHGLFAFRLGTGTVSATFRPAADGTVRALAAGPADSVYVGGEFTNLAGGTRRGVGQLSVATGRPVPAFTAGGVDGGTVSTLVAAGGWLYVGGSFTGVGGTARPALARLSGRTGALDTGFDGQVARQRSGRLRLEKLAVSQDGVRLAIIGTFTEVGGRTRDQLALLSATTGAVSDWYTDSYSGDCHEGYNTYLRDVDFAPDDRYLVAVTTGHSSGPDVVCDSATRFDISGTGFHRPVWVNHTGGHSLFSVAVTGSAVYVGGHEIWLDNPLGDKSAGPGAVYRPGIGAIDPTTGRALSWNPTRSRGVGVQTMTTYPAGHSYEGGLLVGSDTDKLGGEYHARIGAFPQR